MILTNLNIGTDTIYGFDSRYVPRNKTGLPYAADDNKWSLGSATSVFDSAGGWLNVYAQWFRGTMLRAKWADVAEKYESDEELLSGTVVVLGGVKEITKSSKEYDTDVFGIISRSPAITMNAQGGYPVALIGQVPCYVVGPARKGDFLVTSDIPGVAKAISVGQAKQISYFCLLGRVLEDKVSEDIGFCRVLAGKP